MRYLGSMEKNTNFNAICWRESVLLLVASVTILSCVLPNVAYGREKSGVEWVRIPSANFKMGKSWYPSVNLHPVSVPAFQISKTEITVEQYRKCVAQGICTIPETTSRFSTWKQDRDDYPFYPVDWFRANSFCKWAGGRLCSESEWESAARGGGRDRKFPWGDELGTCDYAIMDGGVYEAGIFNFGCGKDHPWPVCSRPRGNTVQGVCDMAGNVCEWVQDWYEKEYDGVPSDGKALEEQYSKPKYSIRVLRGGDWDGNVEHLLTGWRSYANPSSVDWGIRCCRSITP